MEADGGCSLPRFATDASHIWRRGAAVADGAFSRSESEEEWKRIAADGNKIPLMWAPPVILSPPLFPLSLPHHPDLWRCCSTSGQHQKQPATDSPKTLTPAGSIRRRFHYSVEWRRMEARKDFAQWKSFLDLESEIRVPHINHINQTIMWYRLQGRNPLSVTKGSKWQHKPSSPEQPQKLKHLALDHYLAKGTCISLQAWRSLSHRRGRPSPSPSPPRSFWTSGGLDVAVDGAGAAGVEAVRRGEGVRPAGDPRAGVPALRRQRRRGERDARGDVLDLRCHDIVPRVLPHYRAWMSRYGKVFVSWSGATPALCVGD
uniref:Uncharacterized protein n=1 Tax=Oryza glumipatula TaxID=40148 RepID=A0A0E0A628_9ORYZ